MSSTVDGGLDKAMEEFHGQRTIVYTQELESWPSLGSRKENSGEFHLVTPSPFRGGQKTF